MDRQTILSEIRRLAAENSGVAPGQDAFEKATAITQGQWRGKFWLKWSEAVSEAGFPPGRMQEAHSEDFLLACLALLTRELGRFPTSSEVKMQRVRDDSFPNHGTFDRLGRKEARIAKLRAFAEQHAGHADVLALLPAAEVAEAPREEEPTGTDGQLGDGFVYMLKLGRHYKIGKTFDVPRRHRQIDLTLPEKATKVHAIRTDDPAGIEAYWHRRFTLKNTQGEWFALNADDVKAFKRRRGFM